MHCTLLIPGLIWPREIADTVLRGVDLPALTKLLARARMERFPAITPEGWLCQAFEVERQHDWPVAPLTLEADGGDPGDAYWLRADPVHIKVERDRLLLLDNALFDVTAAEAQSLVETLNGYFAGEDVSFHAPTPKRWYAKVARAPELVTRTLREVAGGDVQSHLPGGADALAWNRLFNEAQMLLHEHPVNAAREARGELVLNSVWPWGGGTRPAVRGRPFSFVYSDDPVAIGLGAAAEAHAAGLPADAAAWLRHGDAGEGSHLLVISGLGTAAAYLDTDAWRERIAELERKWFDPLLGALGRGAVASVAIVAPGAETCWRFDVARRDLYRFWRAAKPLSAYA